MRIAHVLRRLSFDDWGGTEQVVWNLAKAQKAAGHEVRLFATTALWRGLAAKDAEAAKSSRSLWQNNRQYVETVDGIEIARFKPVYPWWPMPRRLVDELDRKGGNPFVPGLGHALQKIPHGQRPVIPEHVHDCKFLIGQFFHISITFEVIGQL